MYAPYIGLSLQRFGRGALGRLMKTLFEHQPAPFRTRKGVEIVSGGHPQTPPKRLRPSGLHFFSTLLGAQVVERRQGSGDAVAHRGA